MDEIYTWRSSPAFVRGNSGPFSLGMQNSHIVRNSRGHTHKGQGLPQPQVTIRNGIRGVVFSSSIVEVDQG